MNVSNRWVQLVAGITGMVAVANFQYSWTFFVLPLQARHGWDKADIQYAFFLFFVPAQTWLVPLEGYLAERFGPRKLLVSGGILAGLGWIISAEASSLAVLYAAQALAGCGSGIVYSISIGSALKWFPDRRGLAAGLMAAAFGAGAAATVRPVTSTILHHGYDQAFVWFGLGQALVIIVAALIMRFPRPGEAPPPVQAKVLQSGRDFTPGEMLRSPGFWLIYVMMMMGAIPGLLMIGHIDPMSKDFGVAEMPVTLLWFTSAALPLAVELDRVMGGLTRPVFGWISDHIGREIAIFFAFALEACALLMLIQYAHDPLMFVLMSGLAFFGWGAVFSLFPAVSGDMFGRQFATTNYSLLYTAKGAASLLVALCDVMRSQTGSWTPVFAVMIAADSIAALLALLVLRPLRARLARIEWERGGGMITGQSPRLQWKKNPGGEKRTMEQAKEIARKHGVSLPDDVDFFEDEEDELPENMTARGPKVTKASGAMVRWSDLVNTLTGKVPFLVRPDILASDEAIVAAFAHEMFELEALRGILLEGKTPIEHFIGLTMPNNPGNLHDQAWDYADELVERMRKEAEQ